MGNDGFSTAQYWETRYRTGGNSGAGSRGRLGAFKTHMVNQFVIQNRINGVVEFGCGDGNLLSMLSLSNYVGVNVLRNRACEVPHPVCQHTGLPIRQL